MLEQPSETGGIASGIAGSSDGIESEANAEKSSDGPVRDAVAEEVEEEPGGDHHYYYCGDGGGLRGDGSRQSEDDTGGCEAGNLNCVSGDDRKATEDFSSLKGI